MQEEWFSPSEILALNASIRRAEGGWKLRHPGQPVTAEVTAELARIVLRQVLVSVVYSVKIEPRNRRQCMGGGAECMQSTRVHLSKAPSWLPGARAGGFQPLTQWSNVVNHARAAFSLRPTRPG